MPTIILKAILFLAISSIVAAQNPIYKMEDLATDLDHPWALAYLPDGKILLSELRGAFRIVDTDGSVSQPLRNTPKVVFAGQGGLSDVIIDPEYLTNSVIYFSYAARDAKQDNKLTLFVAKARLNGLALEDISTLFVAKAPRRPPAHYGAKLAIMSDGTLAIASGDGFDFRDQAQKLDNHFGKIIRINTDGSIPLDNPFFGRPDALPEIYSYGHRNPQGLIVNSNGRLIESEHGPRGGDEMNVIEVGKNYGWPAITHGLDYSGAYITPFKSYPNMEQPLHYWVPSIAPSGIMQYTGKQFPGWKNSYFHTSLVFNEVRRLHENKDGTFAEETLFGEANTRLRNIYQSPDGGILLVTDGPKGKLIRITRNN